MQELVPLRGEKKIGSWYLIGALFKVSDEHPCLFLRVSSPRRKWYMVTCWCEIHLLVFNFIIDISTVRCARTSRTLEEKLHIYACPCITFYINLWWTLPSISCNISFINNCLQNLISQNNQRINCKIDESVQTSLWNGRIEKKIKTRVLRVRSFCYFRQLQTLSR